jgi:hypothetical protein
VYNSATFSSKILVFKDYKQLTRRGLSGILDLRGNVAMTCP